MRPAYFAVLAILIPKIIFAQALKQIPVEFSDHILYCELANTPENIEKGLMFRTMLPSDHGMLFNLPYPRPWAFWMKNTLIPLDMIWLNSSKKVIHIVENAKPCKQAQCPIYYPPSHKKALYVLEIGGGLSQTYQIQLGTQLNFETKDAQA